MTDEEVREMIVGSWFGHLALAQGDRAYAIPIFFGLENGVLYFHSLRGHKDEYFDSTVEACLTITQAVSEDRWSSVIIRGPIQEVVTDKERTVAMEALISLPLPPAMGTSPAGEPKRGGDELIYRKLVPAEVSGRKSVPPEDLESGPGETL